MPNRYCITRGKQLLRESNRLTDSAHQPPPRQVQMDFDMQKVATINITTEDQVEPVTTEFMVTTWSSFSASISYADNAESYEF